MACILYGHNNGTYTVVGVIKGDDSRVPCLLQKSRNVDLLGLGSLSIEEADKKQGLGAYRPPKEKHWGTPYQMGVDEDRSYVLKTICDISILTTVFSASGLASRSGG